MKEQRHRYFSGFDDFRVDSRNERVREKKRASTARLRRRRGQEYGQALGRPGGHGRSQVEGLGINSEAEKREFLDRAKTFENQDVYFDYDSYTLTEPAKKVLEEKIAFLKRYPKVQVTIEGHCDERGTTEYNIALGERRAHAAQEYIMSSGASNLKLTTVSYGKERPIATGHDEASFAKNRRDHFGLNY